MLFPNKRITIYAGHYGSGKTNLAVNHALYLREQGAEVSVLDLDIVNPFFRTSDSADLFREKGVRLISSAYANTNVDVPALPPAMYSIFDDTTRSVVADVGGDDAGAVALGRFSRLIRGADDVELVLVINKYRPLAANVYDAANIVRDIENACHARFTAVAANHNLGRETTAQTVLDGEAYTAELSEKLGLPVAFRSVPSWLNEELSGKLERMVAINIYQKQVY